MKLKSIFTRATCVALVSVLSSSASAQQGMLDDSDMESSTIAGTVFYTGTESGKIFVEAFRDGDEVFQKRQIILLDPGPFTISSVPDGEYQVVAFIDTNNNERLDADELWVQLVDEDGNPRYVEPPIQGIELDLDDARFGDRPGPIATNDDDGCATTTGDNSPGWVLVLATLAFVVRSRRRQLS